MSVFKCRDSLFELSNARCNTSYHQTMTITPKTLFEKACKFRLSIRDNTVSSSRGLCQVGDHMSESKETFVDLNAFFLKSNIVWLSSI